MSRGLADIGSGSLHKGGTSDSGRTDTGTGTAAQRELTSEINDLLGGADDDWDDEEAAGEGRREESGKLHDSHSGMTGITARKTDPEPSDIAQSQVLSLTLTACASYVHLFNVSLSVIVECIRQAAGVGVRQHG